MFRSIVYILSGLILLNTRVFGQDQTLGTGYENGTNLNVIYHTERSGKLYAGTRGYGISYRQSKHINVKSRSFFEIDLQNLKHIKETKTQGDAPERRRFVYGKVNSVFLLRGAVGYQNVIFSKADNKAVEIRYFYSIGPTLAFVKPYYLQVYKTNGNKESTLIKFGSENFTADSGRVVGRGAYTDGLPEMKVYPGLTAKFNLSFEYAPYTNLIRAIETGISLDYFPKSISLMARNPSENLIVAFHVGFVFGRKWF